MLEVFSGIVTSALEAVNQSSPAAMVALFLVAAFTEMGIPFPLVMDTVLVLTSYRTGLSLHVAVLMLALLTGREVGASLVYLLTAWLSKPFINWLGKRFNGLQHKLDWLTVRLSRRAPLAVAIARLTPGLLSPASVAAGIMKMRLHYFILGIAISSVIADAGLIAIGFVSRSGIELLGLTPSLSYGIVFLALAIILMWALRRYLGKRHQKHP